MLFRLVSSLIARDSPTAYADLSFRTRGAEVSRIEGFSDAVFGFAITLLVISSRAPDTSAELLSMWHAVLPFIASFAVLFGIWRAQFDFFRRYGLEDRPTVQLTGVLLMIVLLAVYPVKFLCTFFLDVLPVALIAHNDSMKPVMTVAIIPRVIMLYAFGFLGVSWVFSRLYRHAATRHEALGLSAMELFDTRALEQRWRGLAWLGTALVLSCGIMLLTPPRSANADLRMAVGYGSAYALVLATAVMQRRTLRRLSRERQALVGGPSTGEKVPAT